jgi:hypothetical protein
MGDNMRQEVLTIKCYRTEFGDVDVKDVYIPVASLDEAKRVTSERLFDFFKSDRFRSGQQPHSAALVGKDDHIIAKFSVRPSAAGGEEVVEVPHADRA